MIRSRTFREGLSLVDSTFVGACLDLEDIVAGKGSASPGVGRAFSCELGGSSASLLGTGVDSFFEEEAGFALGKELALVVSFKQVESGVTFDSGDDAGPGEDFWKKDMIDRCFADEEAELPVTFLAGVRAAPAEAPPDLPSAMITAASDVFSSDARTLRKSKN